MRMDGAERPAVVGLLSRARAVLPSVLAQTRAATNYSGRNGFPPESRTLVPKSNRRSASASGSKNRSGVERGAEKATLGRIGGGGGIGEVNVGKDLNDEGGSTGGGSGTA